MKNKYVVTIATILAGVFLMFLCTKVFFKKNTDNLLKVGFVYIGDAGTAYTNNFIRAQIELEDQFDDKVQTIAKYNITERKCENALRDLVNQGCKLIFTTNYDYSRTTKLIAAEFPGVQFCQASGDNASSEPFLPNYHNFMGTIYEGKYVSGVVAGMKLLDLIRQGKLSRNKAKLGYVAAFPYAEVISGYTAFFLGVRSIVPEATMTVRYTNTWSNYIIEKKIANRLIFEDDCVIISQHTDTTGPAIACEEASIKGGKTVFHVGYNQGMTDVAPTTSLISCRINWNPYIIAAATAVLKNKNIESVAKTTLGPNDSGAGFNHGWIELIGLNQLIATHDIQKEIQYNIRQFKNGEIKVFSGSYIGENPFNKNDIWDLKNPFPENETRSAPSFCYVLRDVIEIK